jgi:two-component system response regulator HupR/HoxA
MADLPVVLLVDDEVRSLETLRRTLEEDFQVMTASSAREAEVILKRDFVQVILCDQRMPEVTGVEFLRKVRQQWPDVIRIIISGYTDSEDIIAGINEAGIYQYITKPWNPDSLLLTVRAAVHLYNLQKENQHLALELKISAPVLEQAVQRKRENLRKHYDFSRLVCSPESPLNGVCELAARVARFDIPVMITGESGTGKELMARAIHYNSPRADKAFVVENCAALPDQLLESELFGYKKGAFTGAYEDRMGLFEKANGGTIFFDEIGEVSPAFQVKLLRVLQEGEVRPLGSSRTRQIDVRVIAATNRDLEAEVKAGRFRQDLFYRLAGVAVRIPSLRERRMDIPKIAKHVLEQAMRAFDKEVQGISDATMSFFCQYDWPGNVRELQNEIQRMLALTDDPELGLSQLSPTIMAGSIPSAKHEDIAQQLSAVTLKDRVEALEEYIIKETLIKNRGNKSRSADELGLSRVGLRNKLLRYGLEDDEPSPRTDN